MSELEGERAREWSGVESEWMISHFMFFSLPLRCPLGCRERGRPRRLINMVREIYTRRKNETQKNVSVERKLDTRGAEHDAAVYQAQEIVRALKQPPAAAKESKVGLCRASAVALVTTPSSWLGVSLLEPESSEDNRATAWHTPSRDTHRPLQHSCLIHSRVWSGRGV